MLYRLRERRQATMMGLRFSTMQTKPTEILDLTNLTLDEFQILVAPFETAFQAHMRE
jgi:hypothetical protein